ncbi:hypothetical protein BMF94_5738 [Rhodotorula taiwanensis]|uniref:RRM domain-containing protein n=1 Tax=Rhodotorula taiwanensis TaxID=741276 RepID=A0A2S5B3V7_9BASI|nr:hypothetical protein BMF94_5738 [Rhodotorula taiwanensis]
MTISDHLPLDPFPGFSTCSLDFSLDNLGSLYDYQLALVHFHPRATEENKVEAQVVFWRRRIARENRDNDGKVELDAALRQLKRAREWLEGKVPGSRSMRDGSAQTTARAVSRSQARLLAAAPDRIARVASGAPRSPPAAATVSRTIASPPRVDSSLANAEAGGSSAPVDAVPARRAAVATALPLPSTPGTYSLPSTAAGPAQAVTSATGESGSQAGPPSSRSQPSSATGASDAASLPRKSAEAATTTSHASRVTPPTSTEPRDGSESASADACPPELLAQLYTLWVGGFDQSVTPALFLAWLKRRGRESQPAPMAIAQFTSSTYVVAYGRASDVRVAQRQIDGQTLPRRGCKLRAVPGPSAGSSRIMWSDLMPEVRD